MVYSMTGFGQSETRASRFIFSVDIRTLNSKGLDLNIRAPHWIRRLESDIRKLIQNELERGKVEVGITITPVDLKTSLQIPEDQIQAAVEVFQRILDQSNAQGDPLAAALRSIDLQSASKEISVSEEEIQVLMNTVQDCVQKLKAHRKAEGEAMKTDLQSNIDQIKHLLEDIQIYEKERIESVRKRISDKMDAVTAGSYDKDRFEQEMIYYLEKLDINEEKVRLLQHLNYFQEELSSNSASGRKLNFISQEIGREINTLGSKSNHDKMQRIVVEMKDMLEQIKEINLNIV